MGIERDLHDLLFCHDCVIVPQWGGFLTHYRPARLDEARRLIHPPGKDLSFNRHLVRNDGLLADHLAKREGIGFDTATARIDAEVAGWRRSLERQGRLELPQIGIFFRDAEHNLQFEPDRHTNYLKDALGLRPLAAVPVEQAKPAPLVRPLPPPMPVEPEERRRPAMLWTAAAVAAVLFGAAAFWAYRSSGLGHQQWSGIAPWRSGAAPAYHAPETAALIPVERPEPLVLPASGTGIHEVVLDAERDVRLRVDLGRPKEAPAESTAVTVKAAPIAEEGLRYHVVGGCFAQPENADKLLAELQAKGFPARRLKQRGQLHPVVYGSYATRGEALAALGRVRGTEGRSAWLLVR